MKKFRFKLQTLLDQRKAEEDIHLAELAEVRREEQEELEHLNRLKEQLIHACKAIEAGLKDGVGLDVLTRRDEYAKITRDDIRVQELTIEAVQDRVESKRLQVVEAMKERQILEALRDKQEHAYILENDRAEQNSLDEMASLRYARGM